MKEEEGSPDPEISRPSGEEVAAGYVRDFITGMPARATPEEVEAVQVFARRLVEDFGYPKANVNTHPQYRVRRRPSETKKSYPVDIAVFSDAGKRDDNLLMVVECKAESVKEGRKQLELYLSMSSAQVGVWFNGKAHLYRRIRVWSGSPRGDSMAERHPPGRDTTPCKIPSSTGSCWG